MSDTEKKKEKGIEIDLDAFEKQIDFEIDKLFVPSSVDIQGAGEVQQIAPEGGQAEQALELESEELVLDSSDVDYVQEPSKVSAREEAVIELSPDELILLEEEAPSPSLATESISMELEPGSEPLDFEIEFNPSFEAAGASVSQMAFDKVLTADVEAPIELELELADLDEPAVKVHLDSPEVEAVALEPVPAAEIQMELEPSASVEHIDLELEVTEPAAVDTVVHETGPATIELDLSHVEPLAPEHEITLEPAEPMMEDAPVQEPVSFEPPPLDLQPAQAVAAEPAAGAASLSVEVMDRALERDIETPPPVRRDDLPSLLETLDVAYLSLDWDFSPENIEALSSSLASLAPYTAKTQEASSITKILKAILQHLKSKPSNISPPALDLLSESLSFLKTVLLASTPPGPAQKAELKSLLTRVQEIRSKTVRAPQAEPAPEAAAAEAPQTVPSSVLSKESVIELREWMQAFRLSAVESIVQLEQEGKRLQQLQDLLGKKEALAPIVVRLTKVSATIADHTSMLKKTEKEWERRIAWLAEAEIHAAASPSLKPAPKATEQDDAFQPTVILEPGQQLPLKSEPARRAEPAPPGPARKPELRHETVETRQEQVYVFGLSGKRFAVPAACVVKIERLADKKARSFMKRGHATLSDFKPLFKSLKTGVMGTWTAIPDKTLKAYQFLALPYDMMGDTPQPSSFAAVILVSNGKNHGMIFTESAGAEQWTENVEPVADSDWLAGIIRTDTPPFVEILDIDRLLKRMHGE